RIYRPYSSFTSESFNAHGGGFAATNTNPRQTLFLSAVGQCGKKGHDNPGSTGSNGMPQGNGSTKGVQFFSGKVQFFLSGQGHHGKSFVHFKEIHVPHGPLGFFHGVFHGTGGSRGKPLGRLGMGTV